MDVTPLSDTFKMGTAILELMLNDLHLQVTGTIMIFDLSELTVMQQARIITPTSAWHMAMIVQVSNILAKRSIIYISIIINEDILTSRS